MKNNSEFYTTIAIIALSIFGVVAIIALTNRKQNTLSGLINDFTARKELDNVFNNVSKRKMIKGPEINWEGSDI